MVASEHISVCRQWVSERQNMRWVELKRERGETQKETHTERESDREGELEQDILSPWLPS